MPAPDPRHREAYAGVGGQLDKVIGAALRLEQIGGDHGVVREVERLAPLLGRGQQAVAPAPQRLGVVGGDRTPGERCSELLAARLPRDDALTAGPGPAIAFDRERDLAVGEVRGRSLDRLDLELRLDAAAGHGVVLGEALLEPFHHRAQLELAHELAQGAAVRTA